MSMGRYPSSSMTSRSALPMVLSSWSSLFSVLALRSRMIRPEAVKNLTGMPHLQARVPMAMARWVLPHPTSP